MSPDTLLAHFDQISEAPDAVPCLRRFILDLAVRGKLVEQDPNDEPASELLKRIEAEKARLTEARIIRISKPMELIGETEAIFPIPVSWKWLRLTQIGSVIGGGTPPSTDVECFAKGGAGIPWLTPADLGKHTGLYIAHGARDLTEKGLSISSARLMPAGTVLFTSRAPIGYTAIAANEISTNQGFKSVIPFVLECSRYIAIYFEAFASWIDDQASGTTFKEVPGRVVSSLPFPLPPLAEQHRIVAKVDELMVLYDELEAARAKREKRRDRLVAATLHGLNNGEGGEDFRDAARFCFNNLPRLTTRPEHIQQLRQTILNLAVRGKLVKQNPRDEYVHDLLQRIAQEQRVSVDNGHLKKQVMSDDSEVLHGPYSIPEHWRWVPLAKLITFGPQNGVSPKPTNDRKAPKALTLTATTSGCFDPAHYKHIELSEAACESYWLSPGDVLFQRGNTREYVGIAAVFEGPLRSFVFPDLMIRVRFSESLSLRYIHTALISPPARSYLSAQATGASSSMPKISQGVLLNTPIPLPPLAEQRRVVAKVDELMALCAQLEGRLKTTTTTRLQLLEATLHEALSVSPGTTAPQQQALQKRFP